MKPSFSIIIFKYLEDPSFGSGHLTLKTRDNVDQHIFVWLKQRFF